MESYKNSPAAAKKEWASEGQAKIVLACGSEQELADIFMQAKRKKLPCALITDAGRTQIAPGTKTAVGIGPAEDREIDSVAGHLKLY